MSENVFEREVLDRLIKIEAKLESWDKSKEQVYENQREIIKLRERAEQQEEDIDELQDRNKWLSRTAGGAAISAIVAAIVTVVIAFVQFA